jgi:hypothetical protein
MLCRFPCWRSQRPDVSRAAGRSPSPGHCRADEFSCGTGSARRRGYVHFSTQLPACTRFFAKIAGPIRSGTMCISATARRALPREDRAAIEWARQLVTRCAIELWRGERFVARLKPKARTINETNPGLRRPTLKVGTRASWPTRTNEWNSK